MKCHPRQEDEEERPENCRLREQLGSCCSAYVTIIHYNMSAKARKKLPEVDFHDFFPAAEDLTSILH